jgi:ADP-ribose pyrophosphatase YjhB (NUDIX family)
MTRLYPHQPVVGIGIVVLRPNAVLLVRRGQEPAKGHWSLPGGKQELGETAEHAARRELAEETGLAVGDLVLAAYVDSIHHDDVGRIKYHYTILDFAALWNGGEPRAGSDVLDFAWADFANLGPFELWQEAHRVITVARGLLLPAP